MQSPSTTNWVIPERADLLIALSAEVVAKADGNVTADAQPDDPVAQPGTETPLRSKLLVDQMVVKVRAAIRAAGHTPLSVTAGTVPPEAFDHVVNMAAWRLAASTPNIQMYVVTEKGAYSPLGDLNKQAEKWIETLPKHAITDPDDPTGRDWTTAVTWMADVELYTEDELAELDWTWAEFEELGYSYAEWQAITNPPIRGTVKSGSTGNQVDMSLQAGTLGWTAGNQETLGSP